MDDCLLITTSLTKSFDERQAPPVASRQHDLHGLRVLKIQTICFNIHRLSVSQWFVSTIQWRTFSCY
jgi:hypothetical protein